VLIAIRSIYLFNYFISLLLSMNCGYISRCSTHILWWSHVCDQGVYESVVRVLMSKTYLGRPLS